MNLEIISMSIFFAIIGILLWIDRKNVEFSGGIFIRRWKKGLEFIDVLVKRHPKLVSGFGYAAIVLGFLACIGGFISLIVCDILGIKLFGLVLPTAGGLKLPGPIVGIPFWYWLVAIFIILFVHETSHGIFSRAAKVSLKNYGIMLLLVLPIGAFIEPDAKKMKKLKIRDRWKIFAGGSFANFITAGIFILLTFLFSLLPLIPAVKPHMVQPFGVMFNDTINGYPAYDANLTGVITNINGAEVKTTENLSSILNNTNPGSLLNITTSESSYMIKTVARPDNQTGSFIGIIAPETYLTLTGFSSVVLNLFGMIIALNLGVAIANLLPWKPFDGGYMIEELYIKFFKKYGKLIANITTGIVLLLILFNLFFVK
jgi:membrane-associated protease RseP (regulator of RpoE activity)